MLTMCTRFNGLKSLVAVVLTGLVIGCARPGNEGPAAQAEHGHDHEHAGEPGHGHSHDGWWCSEHGVPEELCGQCDSKLAAQFQKKGDWCEQHHRPDTQCFVCHPELEAQFAAKYEAKYGRPPK
jgi:hypothetical protein